MEQEISTNDLQDKTSKPEKKAPIGIIITIVICVIVAILLFSCLANASDFYRIVSWDYNGNFVSATVEVENKTNDYISYTMDLQVWDRYDEWVGYQYMTIRLDPNTTKQFDIVALCSTWDLSGCKIEVRVY